MSKPSVFLSEYPGPVSYTHLDVYKRQREMIMKMCDKGYTIAQIANVAGMDEKQIEDTIKNAELLSV